MMDRRRWALVAVALAVVLLAAALLSRPHGVRLRYVLKRELLWDPCLDIVGHRLPNAFVRRGSRDTAGDVAAVRGLMAEYVAIRLLGVGAAVGTEALGNWFGGQGNTRVGLVASVIVSGPFTPAVVASANHRANCTCGSGSSVCSQASMPALPLSSSSRRTRTPRSAAWSSVMSAT